MKIMQTSNHLRRSLRWKVTLGLVLPLIVIMAVFTYLDYSRLYQSMLKDLSVVVTQSGALIEQNLRQQMIKMDFEAMQQMLDDISGSQGFRAIYLLNRSGKVIFSPGSSDVGLRLSNAQTDCQPCHHLDAAQRPPSIIVELPENGRVFRTMQAIKNSPDCIKCHDASQPIIGLLLIDVPTQAYEQSIRQQLQDHLLWWLGTIVSMILLINFILSKMVLNRLESYSNLLRHSEDGSLPVLPVYSQDELGSLAEAYNKTSAQAELRSAEIQVLSEDLRKQIGQSKELLRHIIHAQEDERKRIARELHDEFGTSLGSLALQVEAVQKFLGSNPERASDQLDQIKKLILNTTDQMYELIMALRPSLLDDLGFAVALRSMAEKEFTKSQINWSIDDSQLVGNLPKELEIPLYRICQEAINNIVRHSKATHVKIQVTRNEKDLTCTISDNGVGFDLESIQINGTETRGLGLMGMQERVAQCEGSLHFQSSPGKGVTILIQIPIKG